ncbi:MAG TPA: lipoyl(octanoyl) transferase LipB [Terriglobales bacterium]|nr:lipoyl(octanoyl) transferase LipB [Terriglobales bacterium]
MISVIQLGTLDYAEGLRLQQQMIELRKNNQIPDVLLLLEHKPVITLGRNAREENVLLSRKELDRRGVELFECDRGGDVTFHGPGQLVGYPIFDLRGYPNRSGTSTLKYLGAVDYVRRLEELLIRTCLDFRIPAKRVPGLTGVWTDQQIEIRDNAAASAGSQDIHAEADPASQEGKIAAIGVHISRSVTSHGFALNVNTDLDYFNLIIPCGIRAKPVTSMAKELRRNVPIEEVAQAVARNFGRVFDRQILWVETIDQLLGRTIGVPVKPPAEERTIRGEEETYWA